MLRDFIQFRAGWFSRFHEALEPSYNERKEREETYLKLLGSSIPPTVSFALKALKQIQAKLPIKGEYLDRYLAPALAARSKSSAMTALALVERTIKKGISSFFERQYTQKENEIPSAFCQQDASIPKAF